MTATTFDSTKNALSDLLRNAHAGRLQLPDFQRGWVWDDDRIKDLLSSVSVSFPIGAIMQLETGGESVRFKPRPIAGAPSTIAQEQPEALVLDGQQRLTSLYQSLMGAGSVQTKDTTGNPAKRWYYFDMRRAVAPEADRDEVVVSVPEDKLVRAFGGEVKLDLSSRSREFTENLFPANQVFDSADWRQGYSRHWNYDSDKIRLFDEFERNVIKRFEQYQLPVIVLRKETPKEAVCLVFERVNTGGVPLTVFELLTASFAAENFQLRDDWDSRERSLKQENPVLRGVQSDDFLQVISLLVTHSRRTQALAQGVQADSAPGITCKRRDLLRLEVADWVRWAPIAQEGFRRAARFLRSQKFFRADDLPYRTQLVPLAGILSLTGWDDLTDGGRRKLAQWYWCGVLGELYGGAIESRFARDVAEVSAQIDGDQAQPITVQDASFQAHRLLTLRTRNSAAYKGIYALLMRDGGLDFRTGEPIEHQTFFDDKIDIHHIFPEKWCKDRGILPEVYNTVVNKTALAAKTNRSIGGRAPSAYLPSLERSADITPARLDEILQSHRIDSELLRADRFIDFLEDRANRLLEAIERAMGKPVSRSSRLFEQGRSSVPAEDGPGDWGDEDHDPDSVSEPPNPPPLAG
jgi:hypothetical protein